MTTYAPPAVRRTPSRAVLLAGVAAITAATVAAGVVVTGAPTSSGTSSSVEAVEGEGSQRASRAALLAVQLEALRDIAAAEPVIGAALAEDIATLEAALSGDIPLEAALPPPTDASDGEYISPPGRYGSRAPAATPDRGSDRVAAVPPNVR